MVNEDYKKKWDDFRETGLFLFINSFLHIFGWSIVITVDDNGNYTVTPERVEYRGFSEESTTKAYRRISKYMLDHASELVDEANQD